MGATEGHLRCPTQAPVGRINPPFGGLNPLGATPRTHLGRINPPSGVLGSDPRPPPDPFVRINHIKFITLLAQ